MHHSPTQEEVRCYKSLQGGFLRASFKRGSVRAQDGNGMSLKSRMHTAHLTSDPRPYQSRDSVCKMVASTCLDDYDVRTPFTSSPNLLITCGALVCEIEVQRNLIWVVVCTRWRRHVAEIVYTQCRSHIGP